MTDFNETLVKRIETLILSFYKEKDFIMIFNVLEKENSKYHYLFTLIDIIKRNIQVGNYNHAFRYYIIAENIMKDYKKNKEEILKRITEYIIEK